MSKIVKIVAPVVQIIGLVTGQFWLVALAQVATMLLAPKAKQQARQAAETQMSLGEVPRQALFGEAATGGSLTDGFNYGGSNGTDWEVLRIALADHECDALIGFYVNDAFVEYTGDGPVTGYDGQLEVYWMPGTEAQAVPSVLTTHGGYTADDNMAGVCHVVVAYKADSPKDKTPIWTAGRPRFLWVLRGKKCYIARLDSTVPGGSGAHRWDDPATWEWTDNPIDCRYNWVRGIFACNRIDEPDMLLVGRGLSAIEAPPERTFAPANLCDEAVALAAGGTEKRYTIGGAIKADEPFGDTEELFAAACGGVITQPEGSVEIEPGAAKTPVVYITDDDLVVGTTVNFSAFLSRADDEWINTVAPRYVDPTQKWADHGAPIRRDIADVIADGGAREETRSLPLVTSGTQAQRVGEILRRLGRLWKRAGITLGPRFAELEEGDWIVWTSARYTAGVPVTFRIDAFNLNGPWQNSLSLREITASVYDWDTSMEIADGAVAEQQTPPTYSEPPDVADWALDTTDDELVLTGEVTNNNADAVIFEYRGWGETVWRAAGMDAADVVRRDIPVTPGEYEVAVSYRVAGVISDRLVLGPVVVGEDVRITEDGETRATEADEIRILE